MTICLHKDTPDYPSGIQITVNEKGEVTNADNSENSKTDSK